MLPSYPESIRRKLARNLLRNALRLRRGEDLLIETWSATLPWATSLELEARLLGARPLLALTDEASYWRAVSEAPEAQLGWVGGHLWAALKASDAYVSFFGPMDIVREERQPPVVHRRIHSNVQEMMRVLQKYGIRTLRWDLGRTSEVWARRYGVDLRTWRRELIEATTVDPRSMRRAGLRIADRLRRGREARISHPNGTELTLRLAGRRPWVDDGMIDDEDIRTGHIAQVVPSGVVSVTPSETEAEGKLVSNTTGVLFTQERETPLGPGRWSFRRGGLAEFDAGIGGPILRQELRRLKVDRLPPGLLSVGLNPKISTIPLLFDQELGTITFEIGRNSHLGGKTRTPHLQAYFNLRGGTLEIDGEPVVDRGRLVTR